MRSNIEIERYNDYFWVNGTKITGRLDFEKLTEQEKEALIKQRKEFLNEKQKLKNR